MLGFKLHSLGFRGLGFRGLGLRVVNRKRCPASFLGSRASLGATGSRFSSRQATSSSPSSFL